MKKKTIKYITLVLYLIALVILTLIAIPFIRSIENPADFKEAVTDYGISGYAMMMFVQIAQIIVALIPGEVIEFLAGTLYGWLGGLIFCLIGIAIGQTIIFVAVKFLGRDFVENAAGSKVIQKFGFLKDEKKLRRLVFILFFIPGTPKDLITYAVPLTNIKLSEFLLISLFARIPSVVSSTYAGSAYGKRQYIVLIIAYSVILLLTLAGILIYKLIEKKFPKSQKE